AHRGPQVVAALVAVAELAAVLVPIDPVTPDSRIRFVLADAAVAVVLTDVPEHPALADGPVILPLDRAVEAIELREAAPRPAAVFPADLAYILYTSGSTGRP